MGYRGDAAGLLDADTNMTYAVKYLAGAYHVAGGNPDRAVHYYASGYYYAAKRRGMNDARADSGLAAFASTRRRRAARRQDRQGAPVERERQLRLQPL